MKGAGKKKTKGGRGRTILHLCIRRGGSNDDLISHQDTQIDRAPLYEMEFLSLLNSPVRNTVVKNIFEITLTAIIYVQVVNYPQFSAILDVRYMPMT